jgi:hypothetical protein
MSDLRPLPILLLCLLLQIASPVSAQSVATASTEPLDGRAIYERVTENRYESFVQRSDLISGDRAGNEQRTRLDMWYQSFRSDDGEPLDGTIVSKTVVRYTYPFDLRHTGYLVIQNQNRPNDQFVYRASKRRIQRVNLRKEAVFGTDFSFEDLVPREIEDADYARDEDAEIDGETVYVVTAIPKPHANSEYSKFQSYIDPKRWVPVRVRYWDDAGVEVKELVSTDLELRDRIWVPMHSQMRNLRGRTWTKLAVEKIEPNIDIERHVFDLRRLETH